MTETENTLALNVLTARYHELMAERDLVDRAIICLKALQAIQGSRLHELARGRASALVVDPGSQPELNPLEAGPAKDLSAVCVSQSAGSDRAEGQNAGTSGVEGSGDEDQNSGPAPMPADPTSERTP